MISIGIGCSSTVREEAIYAIIQQAQTLVPAMPVLGLFTIDSRTHLAALQAVAHKLNLPLIGFSKQRLADFEVATPSCASLTFTGLLSVSEAAALCGAGEGGRLLVPKIKGDGVTIAIGASA